MTIESLPGKIVVFYLPGTVKNGVAITKPLLAQVLTAEECEPAKGDIPNAKLRVRGRSGKELVIDVVEHYSQFFDSWAEAIHYAELLSLSL